MKYYSRSTKGFYDSNLMSNPDNLPADAVEVSDEKHKELMTGQGSEKRIESDENGNPVLVDNTQPVDELKRIKKLQINRAFEGAMGQKRQVHASVRFEVLRYRIAEQGAAKIKNDDFPVLSMLATLGKTTVAKEVKRIEKEVSSIGLMALEHSRLLDTVDKVGNDDPDGEKKLGQIDPSSF